jgi:hypothetical protein
MIAVAVVVVVEIRLEGFLSHRALSVKTLLLLAVAVVETLEAGKGSGRLLGLVFQDWGC